MPEPFDVAPRAGESRKAWLARLLREGCPALKWCELADAHAEVERRAQETNALNQQEVNDG